MPAPVFYPAEDGLRDGLEPHVVERDAGVAHEPEPVTVGEVETPVPIGHVPPAVPDLEPVQGELPGIELHARYTAMVDKMRTPLTLA